VEYTLVVWNIAGYLASAFLLKSLRQVGSIPSIRHGF
jgi:hypothetical protein